MQRLEVSGAVRHIYMSYTTIYIKLTHLRVIIYWQHVSVVLCDHHQANLTPCVPSMRVQYGIPYVLQTVFGKKIVVKTIHYFG
jgi:hypothetical protein